MDGIAFDNNLIYLFKNNVVKVYNKNILIKTFFSDINIKAMCYDIYLHCFWAITPDINNKVFKLNKQFQVIGRILYTDLVKKSPVSLCHNIFTDVVNINFGDVVLTISKSGDYINVFDIKDCDSLISCCYSKIIIFSDFKLKFFSQNGAFRSEIKLNIEERLSAVCIKSDNIKKIEFYALINNQVLILTITTD